jgi:hypothetical protein
VYLAFATPALRDDVYRLLLAALRRRSGGAGAGAGGDDASPGVPPSPIVPAAILFDLSNGGEFFAVTGPGGTVGNIDVDGTLTLSIDAVAFVYGSLGAVLAVKSALFFLFFAYRASASIAALAQDSLNDMISDVAALIAIVIVVQVPSAWWVDPMTAMLISVFLIYTWVRTGREHVIGLVGYSANKTQLAQITYLAMNHDARVLQVDTVRAYFVGLRLLVELDIVLPAARPLREAHDIGEALQLDVEKLDFVEHASVHLEYETSCDGSRRMGRRFMRGTSEEHEASREEER